jgi:hypothetical protein
MARRLSIYVERYSLLPNRQFGGIPGRYTEQELLILVAIWKVWRKHKVVTLMAFAIKGTFNSVDRTVLGQSPGEFGITLTARKWIASFTRHRLARIKFEGYSSPTAR